MYVSGPMSGRREANIDAFRMYQKHITKLGHVAYIPHDIKPYNEPSLGIRDAVPWSANIRGDIIAMLQLEGVTFLSDWAESHGARFENQVAAACGMPGYLLRSARDVYRLERIF
jgi:hypothetical protein